MAALLLGRLFDRIGIGVMILATCASALSAPLAFFGGPAAATTGMVLWGIGMGAQGSVMRAAIAPLAPASQRGTAYGIFNAAYGLAWLAGSSLLGVLYDWLVPALAAVSVVLQGAAVAILWRVYGRRRSGQQPAGLDGKYRRSFRAWFQKVADLRTLRSSNAITGRRDDENNSQPAMAMSKGSSPRASAGAPSCP